MDALKVLRFSRNGYLSTVLKARKPNQFVTNFTLRQSSTSTEKKEDTEIYALVEDDYEIRMMEKEQEIELKRNKSRLNHHHRNIIQGKVPFDEPMDDAHLTLKYKRRIFGRYGSQSNINPAALWPNPDDIKYTMDYEKIAFPYSIQEMITRQRMKIEQEQKEIMERQEKILGNIKKLEQWKKEIADRAAKKLADLAKAKAKKDALIEEVRKHFGYKVDPKDEKFKEMLILKERAQKKKLKEEKSKAKQERLLEELMKK